MHGTDSEASFELIFYHRLGASDKTATAELYLIASRAKAHSQSKFEMPIDLTMTATTPMRPIKLVNRYRKHAFCQCINDLMAFPLNGPNNA